MERGDLKYLYGKIVNSGIFSMLPPTRSLSQLECLREIANWEFEDDRHRFYSTLCHFIRFWEGPVPKLEDIFQAEEIEWLLIEFIKSNKNNVIGADSFFEFIAMTGYKDKPLGGELSKLRTTAVHQAARRYFSDRSRKIPRELFEIYDNFEMNYTDDSGLSHLHVACVSGYDKVVEKFLEFGQDPNLVWEETGDTPLHMALANGHKNLIRLLLSRGADPNVANKEGLTALHVLCMRENDDLTEIFFETVQAEALTVDALDEYGNAPLHFAVDNKLIFATGSLLLLGANPNLSNEDGSSPLHVVCSKYDEVKLLEMLLDAYKDQKVHVDVQDKVGRTPLHLALALDNERAAELLLRAGADPNFPDGNGSTPLHVICSIKGNDDDSLKTFFDVNDRLLRIVDANARDSKGRTPLDVALARGNSKLIELLLSRGVDSCTVYRDGSTPLHHICNFEGNDDGLLRAFFKFNDKLDRTVDVDARDAKGRTPADVAFARGNSKLIALLVARGAHVSFANVDGTVQIREAQTPPSLIREIEKTSLQLREMDTKDQKVALQIRDIQKKLIFLKKELMKPVRCNECGSMLVKI
uniref:Uncharacterized protein n=1 Tax=Trichogramma kaykai TaxID=54128 RepID=A0ABD2WGP0_9HYME